jgi:hypothetical protein
MASYEIYFRCNDCKREHPIHLKIHLDHGLDRKQSIAEFFPGRSTPPQVMAIRGHKVFCLKTGRSFTLENDDQIFLALSSVFLLPDEK